MTKVSLFSDEWFGRINSASGATAVEEEALRLEELGGTVLAEWLELRVSVTDIDPDLRGYHLHILLSPTGRFLARSFGPVDVPWIQLKLESLDRWSGQPYRALLREGRGIFRHIEILT